MRNQDYHDMLAALVHQLEGVQVSVLGRADLITNKQATGREKHRFDVRGLEGKS